MRKKRIKAKLLACVLICILPTTTFAMDKEEFFRRLINSSYPEANTSEDKESANNDNTKKNNSDDYIKVHIGEENIPTLKTDDNKTENESENKHLVSLSTQYKDNVRVTKDNPRMLIYHSHAGETYSESPSGNYHSKDMKNSVIKVGSLLTEQLTNKGWGVVHNTTYNDYPSHNDSYKQSSKLIESMAQNYKGVDIAIDLHRDGRTIKDETSKKTYHDEYTTKINGESVAKVSFVVGMKNEPVDEIMKIANDLTSLANDKYPGIARPVVKKPYGRYNQYMVKNAILIEIGSNAVSVEEASASTKYIADVLDSYFK